MQRTFTETAVINYFLLHIHAENLLSYTQNKIEIILKMQVLRSWYAHCGPSVIRTAVIRIPWWSRNNGPNIAQNFLLKLLLQYFIIVVHWYHFYVVSVFVCWFYNWHLRCLASTLINIHIITIITIIILLRTIFPI